MQPPILTPHLQQALLDLLAAKAMQATVGKQDHFSTEDAARCYRVASAMLEVRNHIIGTPHPQQETSA
jgi:hypothetical protein